MESALISTVAKARRYAEELDRIRFQSFAVTFRGEHDIYQVTYQSDVGWSCTCNTFVSRRSVCSHIMALEKLLGETVTPAQLPELGQAEVPN